MYGILKKIHRSEEIRYTQTSFIRTSLIRMILNPNTFSWEPIFLVLFVLLNPNVQILANVVFSIQLTG